MPAPTPSSTSGPAPIMRLPSEIHSLVFSRLDDPGDLYHASLACTAWRTTATQTRLWEDHYWRFYRGSAGLKGSKNVSVAQRSQQQRHTAMRQWFWQAFPATSSPRTSTALPPFLEAPVDASAPIPDFYKLFTKRMTKDNALLLALSKHVTLSTCTLGSMLKIIDRYGDAARDLLAALAADQQIHEDTIADLVFTESEDGDEPPLRALDVHSRAAAGRSQPQRRNCLALRSAAQAIRSHLLRREAIRSLSMLRQRWKSNASQTQTLRERVLAMSLGTEEAFTDLALFRNGERGEVGSYLDLLALYVWSWLLARQQQEHAGKDSSSAHQVILSKSTRYLMTGVNLALHSLNFGLADAKNAMDLDNSFLNVAICCPTQRQTLAPTLMAITCAVAQRLGIAAAPLNTPGFTMAVVIEDSVAPATWVGDNDEQEWSRFYLEPRHDGPTRVSELGRLKATLAAIDRTDGQSSDIASIVEPPSPDVILYINVIYLNSSLEQGPDLTQGDRAGRSRPHDDAPKTPTGSPSGGITALRNFLAARSSSPPWPLASPLLPSTLAFLPSTRAGAARVETKSLREDAQGVVAWMERLAGGAISNPNLNDLDQQIMATCIGDHAIYGPHRGDIALLLELGGGNVMPWLDIRGQVGMDDDDDEADGTSSSSGSEQGSGSEQERERASTQSQKPRPSDKLNSRVGLVIGLDRLPCNGMGGSGGANQLQRDPPTVRPLDQSFPADVRAQFHIGTVFKHREQGYYGVVVGRESQCRAPEAWMIAMRVDQLPSGGRHQPFYSVIVSHDESNRYVAQCNIVPVHVSSKNDVGVLRELVPLFNLRTVGKLFRTVRIIAARPEGAGGKGEKKSGKKKKKGGKSQGEGQDGGEVRMVMNEWMRGAWPHD